MKFVVTQVPHKSGATYVRISNRPDTAHCELYVGVAEVVQRVVDKEYPDGALTYVNDALEERAGQTVAWMSWIRVGERSRHRGVGGRLVDFAVAWALEHLDAEAVYAVTVTVDERADPLALQDWYVRHGARLLSEYEQENAEIVWELVRR